MEYSDRGFRIYKRSEDAYGDPVRVQRSSLATDKAVWIFGDKSGQHIELSRAGALDIVGGLTAFLADTDDVPDLPEPDAGR